MGVSPLITGVSPLSPLSPLSHAPPRVKFTSNSRQISDTMAFQKKTSRHFTATVSGASLGGKEAPETVAVKCREVFFWEAMVSEIWREFGVNLA